MTYRQIKNNAGFGMRLEVFQFKGSFLSIAIDLPDTAISNMTKSHLFCMDIALETERALEIFSRLNVKHGPNVQQIVRKIDLSTAEMTIEFDLGYSKINEKRIEKIWLDLIFEGPDNNAVMIHDLVLSRSKRAEV